MTEQTSLVSIVVGLLALSLIGAPITMADWGEAGYFSVERIEESQVTDDMPVLQYEALSTPAQNAIRRAIESPDGSAVVYGREDWPGGFDYGDSGYRPYVLIYEGQYYRLSTGAQVSPLYYLYVLPFVAYGFCLGVIAYGVFHSDRAPRIALLAAVPGIAFHLLGPEFDFPVLAPMEFVGLGVLATIAFVIGLIWDAIRGG